MVFWLIFLLILLAIIAYYWKKSDFFKPVQVSIVEKPFGDVKKFTVFYKHIVGEYKNLEKHFKEMCKFIPKSVKTFGLYYDDPSETPPEKCECIIGCIYKIDDKTQFDQKTVEELTQNGYKEKSIPTFERAVYTKQRFNTWLCLIKLIMFTYPAMKRYIQVHQIHVSLAMEFNTVDDKDFLMDVYFPICDRESYLVEEYQKQ